MGSRRGWRGGATILALSLALGACDSDSPPPKPPVDAPQDNPISNRLKARFVPWGFAYDMAVSPDEKTVAIGSFRVEILDAEKLKRSTQIDLGIGIGSLDFSPSGKFLAVGTRDGRLCVLDTQTWKTVQTHTPFAQSKASQASINRVRFLGSDETLVVTAESGRNGSISIDRATGKLKESLLPEGVKSYNWARTADASAIALDRDDASEIAVIDGRSGKISTPLKGYSLLHSLVFDRDGKHLIGCSSAYIAVWNCSTWQEVRKLDPAKVQNATGSKSPFGTMDADVSSNGRFVATVGTGISLIDLEKNEVVAHFPSGGASEIRIKFVSSDGALLVCAPGECLRVDVTDLLKR